MIFSIFKADIIILLYPIYESKVEKTLETYNSKINKVSYNLKVDTNGIGIVGTL